VDYPVESFSESEQARLQAHFTNLDRPVFALVNLPETVKGALFARYSRYPGTLRRLFLDEFAGDLPPVTQAWDGAESGRASQLYDRIFLGYGDDSVAQLGGAHVACEWVSNILTKILQRPRLGAYLEQSTRYIAYDAPMPDPPGGYRYYRDHELGPSYATAMDALFSIYSDALPRVTAWAEQEFPLREGEAPAAHARALKAKALDLLRGLLPASSLSHMGIFATGQTYEQLILHLLAHPLPEARHYGQMILGEIKTVMPSFVARVERPDRGGEWIGYLESRARAGERWAARLGLGGELAIAPSVTLLRAEGDEDDLLAALLFESAAASEETIRGVVGALDTEERSTLLSDLVGARTNRRHRPGRGLEALRYRFEIVSDYGAFRDLQRHRMLTIQWQTLTPDLGAGIPEQIELAGCGDEYRRALETSRAEYDRLVDAGLRGAAPYALCLGYRIRYILDLNAREAMQLIELRSGREGHPTYRAVAHEMQAQIATVHPAVAESMKTSMATPSRGSSGSFPRCAPTHVRGREQWRGPSSSSLSPGVHSCRTRSSCCRLSTTYSPVPARRDTWPCTWLPRCRTRPAWVRRCSHRVRSEGSAGASRSAPAALPRALSCRILGGL
jgi:thymidylate synthase ThyX